MSYTRTQLIANTREMMDAVNSTRWDDSFISTTLGIASKREWSGILGCNPYYRFAQRSVTTSSAGLFAYTDLNSGSDDSAQTWGRIFTITDGSVVYREVSFASIPLGTSTNLANPADKVWYDAGSNVQILPTGAVALTVSINYTPPRVDQLSADDATVDFPDGHESILWLEAAAMLLSKGGAENDAAQTMRAMAEQERQLMYADIGRRSTKPTFLEFPDRASEWGG
jgi:hypothetical protein